MQIVTGRRGEPHVTSRQMQAVYRSFLGDFALLDVGAHLAATATSNDNVRISDGVVAVQGIYAVIAYNEYDDNYIEPVSVGMKRIDTLILHYTKSNDIEDMQIEVVEGEEAVDNPVAPTIAEGGDAWEGTADIKVPIYDVLVTSFGLTVTPYSRMNTLIPTLDSIAERIPETVVTGVKGDSEALYRNGNVNITKDNIGLGNVDNTADTDKPVSNATQTALNLKADLTYVDAKIAAAYHAGGSKTVAELTSALLIADNMGKVYNMSDSGTTTSDFVEGAGEPINEGDNVGICNVGTEENPVYKFDLLSGFVDLSAYVTTSALNTRLAEKVDKFPGKGLSTNDYTDEEKQKLANIESNAQANVQSDWNEDDTEDDGYIKNKPNLSTSLTATGNPITIESSESNLVECVAEVEAVQEGSGDPSPDNIRPIIGQTEVVIEDCGKNLFDASSCVLNKYIDDDGTIGNANGYMYTGLISVKNGSYHLSGRYTGVGIFTVRLLGYDENGDFISLIDRQGGSENNINLNGNISNSISYMRISLPQQTENVQLELGNTATTYEPYKGKTYTIQLGDTIYGGELDVVTGELRVTHGEVDLGDLDYYYNSADTVFYSLLNNIGRRDNSMCSQYVLSNVTTGASLGNGMYMFRLDLNRVYIKDTRYTNATAFKTAVTGQTLVYELAEPYTIQLTPEQIRLLKGTNNISCNTGNLSIKYYPDNVLGQLKGDIEGEYDERVETLETQVQELQPSLIFMSRERRDITSDLSRLSTAVAEQNLPKYGYKIGDYFTGASGYTYILADYNTFKGTSTPYCISTNHIGIVVDTHQTSQWHSGEASNVGYNGSVLNTFLKGTVLDTIKTDFKALFGGSTGLEHLIAHSKLYTTALANWAWQANQYISALTCTQIDAGSQWTANGFQEGEASKSLELFRKYKWTEIFGNESPWLRDLSSGSSACNADADGHLDGAAGVTRSRFVVGLINFH